MRPVPVFLETGSALKLCGVLRGDRDLFAPGGVHFRTGQLRFVEARKHAYGSSTSSHTQVQSSGGNGCLLADLASSLGSRRAEVHTCEGVLQWLTMFY